MNLLHGRVRWLLISWMFVISAIAYLDRVNISIAGSSIKQEFHLGNKQLGWVFSAFVLGYALFQAPCGRLADRFGPRKVLTLAAVWWALFTSLTALVPGSMSGALAILLAVRFLLGVGESVTYPASNRLVASWIPSAERGFANGLIFAGVGAGAGVAPPLVTYILVRYGWRWSFWITALMGLAAGVVWVWVARNKPQEHPWTSTNEAAYIESGLPLVTRSEAAKPLAWGKIFTSKNVLAMSFSYFAYGYVAYIFFSWFFLYLSTVRGLELKSSARYGMLPFLAMAVCSPLGGWISDQVADRFGQRAGRCGVACLGMGLCAIFVALGPYAHDARLASVVLAGGAGALYISQSAFWSVTSDIAGHSAGSASGVMNMTGQIGGVATASLTPLIADSFGWEASFLVAAALCAVGAMLWLLVEPQRAI